MKTLRIALLIVLSSCTASQNDLVTNRGANQDNWWDELPRAAWSVFPKVDQSQTWFEVYNVGPGIFAIHEPGQFEEVISYLIVGDERALLFDTGLGIGDMAQVASELTQLPITVLNSHSHYDHIGGNFQFKNILGLNTPYTLTRTNGLLHNEVSEFVGPGWIWKDTPVSFSTATYEIQGYSIDRFLSDGEILDLGNRPLKVIFTPGHAPDAICLLDEENRLLFTGDTFYPAPLYAHLPGSNFQQYAKTARLLANMSDRIDHLMPAHNQPKVTKAYLTEMDQAFKAIAAGEVIGKTTDGAKEYEFDGFSILVPEAFASGRP